VSAPCSEPRAREEVLVLHPKTPRGVAFLGTECAMALVAREYEDGRLTLALEVVS